MSDFKNVMKGGWHPKGKEGGKESWRGDFKGINQVAGWMGKGKKPGENQASEHISRPLASLKDPASFGPPPRNVNYHGGAALPNQITPHTGGLGAPLSQSQIDSANRATNGPTQEELEEQEKQKGPPLPYRADRTGLNTSHLPPPPVKREVTASPVHEAPKPQPRLPPRLPARQNISDATTASSPPPAYTEAPAQSDSSPANGTLNQSAMNRLGNAGVNVAGLGIGKNNNTSSTTLPNPWKTERSQSQTSQSASKGLSELQSRFSRMNSNSNGDTSPQTQPPATSPPPPSLQQSQSAFRTASNFHKDPSSVSVADAKSAASTANTAARSASAFREKHADSISAASQRANAFDKKYQLKSRFETFLDKHAPLEDGQDQQNGQQPQVQPQMHPQAQQIPPPPQQTTSPTPEMAASISRKPPPPPPPKKPAGMHGNASVAAPPVPLGTKPNFS